MCACVCACVCVCVCMCVIRVGVAICARARGVTHRLEEAAASVAGEEGDMQATEGVHGESWPRLFAPKP